jgi:death-on-curing protein
LQSRDPIFLSTEQVLALHKRSIEALGGTLGVRDEGGLEAAVNQPKHAFYYGSADLFDLAATDAFRIAEGQYFLDGNKRTAATSALTFLGMNGIALKVYSDDALSDLLIGIAEKRFTKSDLAEYFREPSP